VGWGRGLLAQRHYGQAWAWRPGPSACRFDLGPGRPWERLPGGYVLSRWRNSQRHRGVSWGTDSWRAPFTEKLRPRGQCPLPGGSARALATQSCCCCKSMPYRIGRACFASKPRGHERQFGAGYSGREPITEAWARRGRCLLPVALTGASDAQETGPGGGEEMRPGGRRRVDYQGAGPRPEGRGLGARHEVSARIRAPRRAAAPPSAGRLCAGGAAGVEMGRAGVWHEASSQTAPCLHY
jgi:hypothetical protein